MIVKIPNIIKKISAKYIDANILAKYINFDNDNKGSYNLLCMDRACLSQDIDTLKKFGELNYSKLNASIFESYISRYVEKNIRVQTFFHNTFKNMDENRRKILINLSLNFLTEANKLKHINAVLVGNSDYWQDEPLKIACKILNIPFIVLSRENYIDDFGNKNYADRMTASNFQFEGDLMCVASEKTRILLSESGHYDSDKVIKTGWPRIDNLVLGNSDSDYMEYITLFSYHEKLYGAINNYKEVLYEFINLSKKYPHIKFIIKVKKISHAKYLIKRHPRIMFYPVKIVWNELSSDIISKSYIVIGYNTTGIIESLLTKVNIIIPWWGDAIKSKDMLVVNPNSKLGVNIYKTPLSRYEFIKLITYLIENRNYPKNKMERLVEANKYIYIPDEGSSKLFEKTVIECIKNREKNGK